MFFDSKKFFKQRINSEKMDLPYKMIKEIKQWDGKKVHRFSNKNVRRRIFGEQFYIYVGSEKIGISEEFTRNEQ